MIRRFFTAVAFALSGLKVAWADGMNFRVAVVCAALACLLGLFFKLTPPEFAFIILAIGGVLAAEAFNTALEELCDKFQPTHDPHIKKIKDLAAAAVLLSSLAALLVGILIFLPHLTR
jgi:diacylglycerol kinase